MKFIVDKCLGIPLAEGMAAFGEEVVHLSSLFGPEEDDTEWLKFAGEHDYFVITRDLQIKKKPHEKNALQNSGVGAFFLAGKRRNRCQLIQQMVKHWPDIKEFAEKHPTPFMCEVKIAGLPKAIPF